MFAGIVKSVAEIKKSYNIDVSYLQYTFHVRKSVHVPIVDA